ncbi:MAG: sigma-54 dependent transcriptional regulator [Opitutaceae bacterium]|jgi:DNA-binding NtrC family response regulator|nr:sigma-54 dependent transcriptional regulator [Opitutaceae bacterium]
MPSVLIVDDLLSIHEMLDAVIQPTGYTTAFATDGEKALVRYKAEKYDLVLADIDMKPMDGITLLRQLKAYDPTAVVIIMTAYASTESAVQALKFGAFDYLQKPFRVDDLIATLRRALDYRKLSLTAAAGSAAMASAAANTSGYGIAAGGIDANLVGTSAAHKKLIAQLKKLAAVRTPVLLQGETGSGKTTVAELLHSASAASGAPFVRVDCIHSADPGFHAGLFGEKGAGGAWVHQAKDGTLLLQNLDQLSAEHQHELVGVLRGHLHGLRLICTSTQDLEALTEEGRFNDELFYRVASLPVQIPALRDRPEDIPALVKHFTAQTSNPHFDSKLIEFNPEALAILKSYSWPGNCSELNQIVSKIVASADTRMLGPDQLPLRIKDLGGWPKLAEYLALQEKHYVEQVLKACRGDKVQAARILGVDVSRVG